MMSQLRGWEWVLTLLVWAAMAAIPIVIVYARKAANPIPTVLVSILTSWTCVGWVVALIMSVASKKADSGVPAIGGAAWQSTGGTSPVPPSPPPGMYTDPQDPTRQRYWSGSAWGPTTPAPPQVEGDARDNA
jgi:hypothetical protein